MVSLSDDPGLCANCAAELRGPFCHRCGQERLQGRFTLPGVLARFAEEALNFDRGFFGTAAALTRHPGRTVQDYWAGRTRPYTSPIKYFLIAVTLAQIVSWRSGFIHGFAGGFTDGTDLVGSADAAGEFITNYFVLLLAAGIPFPTLVARVASSRNLAEEAIFSLFVFGQLALLFVLSILIGRVISSSAVGGAFVVLGAGYYVWARVGSLGARRWRSVLGALLVLPVAWVLWLISVALLLMLA